MSTVIITLRNRDHSLDLELPATISAQRLLELLDEKNIDGFKFTAEDIEKGRLRAHPGQASISGKQLLSELGLLDGAIVEISPARVEATTIPPRPAKIGAASGVKPVAPSGPTDLTEDRFVATPPARVNTPIPPQSPKAMGPTDKTEDILVAPRQPHISSSTPINGPTVQFRFSSGDVVVVNSYPAILGRSTDGVRVAIDAREHPKGAHVSRIQAEIGFDGNHVTIRHSESASRQTLLDENPIPTNTTVPLRDGQTITIFDVPDFAVTVRLPMHEV